MSEGVCCRLAFRLLDATLRWRVDAPDTIAAFVDELDPTDNSRRLCTGIGVCAPRSAQLRRAAACGGSDVRRGRSMLAGGAGSDAPAPSARRSSVRGDGSRGPYGDSERGAGGAAAARLRGVGGRGFSAHPDRPAPARGRAELLDTGDLLDPRFPIHSSAELYRLTLIVEWAKACRLVLVVRGRLVPVRRAAKLLDRPLELVARMLEALPRLGDELGDSLVAFDADDTVAAVFGELVGRGGRLSAERACEVAWKTATARYWFPHATEQQLDGSAGAPTVTFGGCSRPPPSSACSPSPTARSNLRRWAAAACPRVSAWGRPRPAF
jgi:hypothetical protein